VPSGPVRTVEDLMTDEHVLEHGMIIELEHQRAGRIRTLGSPLHLLRTPTSTGEAAPVHGEHGAQVLREFGYSEDEVSQFVKAGAIHLPL
jgi:crotonobetainyl-CoA:carnitine CoA-transferase CaiB-like acyl-CoA transferase